MAWTRHGNRRRRDDRRALLTHVAPVHPGDRLAEPPAADPWQVLNREIDRCRRYGHPLALVRVVAGRPSDPTPPAARTRREGRPSRRRPGPLAELAATVLGTVRSGDATWVHGPAAFVLAPETDGPGAEAMADRIRAVAAEALGVRADVRIAAFPEDGLTGHALRESVTARGPRLPTPRSAPAGPSGAPGGWAAVPRFVDGPRTSELRGRAD